MSDLKYIHIVNDLKNIHVNNDIKTIHIGNDIKYELSYDNDDVYMWIGLNWINLSWIRWSN